MFLSPCLGKVSRAGLSFLGSTKWLVCRGMYVCMHVCMHAYMYVCMYAYVYYIHMCIGVYVYISICAYVLGLCMGSSW